MCVIKCISERCLRGIYKLDCFSNNLRLNWTGRFEQIFKRGIDGERVV